MTDEVADRLARDASDLLELDRLREVLDEAELLIKGPLAAAGTRFARAATRAGLPGWALRCSECTLWPWRLTPGNGDVLFVQRCRFCEEGGPEVLIRASDLYAERDRLLAESST